jgi:YVTN family beta-propeller protein
MWAIALFLIAAIFVSCEDDNNNVPGTFDNGILISNEGAWGAGNGSISYYSYDGDSIANDIFRKTNGRQIGDVIQDIETNNDRVYIVVNASNKVEVANRYTMEQRGTIEQLNNPRYAEVANNGKLYVSQWGYNGKVHIFDGESLEQIDSVDVGTGPEELLAYQNYVYIANGGGYGFDNTISVIDTENNEEVTKIEVGDCPKSLVMDANDKLWVLCHGHITYDSNYDIATQTGSQLVQVDPQTNQVTKTIDISQTLHPAKLAISNDGQTLYYGGLGVQGIYALDINETAVPAEPLIDIAAYGFGTEEEKDVIYVGVAPSFSEAGKLVRFDYDGNQLGEYTAGVGPNGIGENNHHIY